MNKFRLTLLAITLAFPTIVVGATFYQEAPATKKALQPHPNPLLQIIKESWLQ